MKALVVYHTQMGRTEGVARAIAAVLGEAGETGAIPIEQLTAADLEGLDLLVAGSPTHYQNLPKEARPRWSAIPKGALAGVWVAAFDTARQTWGPLMWMTAAHRLLPILRKRGGRRAARPETFLVDAENNLVEGETARARALARTLLERVHG